MSKNRYKIEPLMKSLILISIAIFFIYIIATGKVLLYVHPRIVPYIKISIPVMLILALATMPEMFRPRRRSNKSEYMFFLIPIALAILIPGKTMDSSTISFSSIEANTLASKAKDNSTSNNSSNQNNEAQVNKDTQSESDSKIDTNNGLLMINDEIVMTDTNFVKWVTEISENMNKYKGKKISAVGFVFKSDMLSKNEFVPARLMMTCCTADLQPVGFLCRYNEGELLTKDSWVLVKGTIDVENYKGQDMPVIIGESVEKADKPKVDYVYPY
ncbi:TIGR03943 family protein [Clostridium zeae]|uniref:TIGR03943 family protein n=1 Tax=Clostridium zeae TaxID=2759022 RepID=A0ABQ1ED43_9CLOT|nr:TIGR03943 family protein [Clostridium zeae]GFZ32664.1 TIGR03943 family protein [Clostridium zeae]